MVCYWMTWGKFQLKNNWNFMLQKFGKWGLSMDYNAAVHLRSMLKESV